MADTMWMEKTSKQQNGGSRELHTIKVTKVMHALILKIGAQTEETTDATMERLLPQGALERELQRAIRAKLEALGKELKDLDKKK